MKKYIVAIVFLFTSAGTSFAQLPQQEQRIHDAITYFQTYTALLLPPQEQIPTVVEVPVTSSSTRNFALYEMISDTLQPFQIIPQTQDMPYKVMTDDTAEEQEALNDNNSQTYVQYELINTSNNQVSLFLNYAQPISTTSLSFLLDENVQLPTYITIQTITGDKNVVVLSRKEVTGTTIMFPETRSDRFTITFEHTQPLRISEIGFIQTPQSKQTSYVLRFLARPGEQYYLYQDPQGTVPHFTTAEGSNLSAVTDALVLFPPAKRANEFFKKPDTDSDGIDDSLDNCVMVSNADQRDVDGNSTGDACEDFDVDGVMNNIDNCPDNPNRLQQDEDGDGFGDHCDPEESRLTERLWWLPWLGIGVGFSIVTTLLVITVKHPVPRKQTKSSQSS